MSARRHWVCPRIGVKSKTRLSPGRVMVCLAQGACLIRAKVWVQGCLKSVVDFGKCKCGSLFIFPGKAPKPLKIPGQLVPRFRKSITAFNG
jgi:hypothetical protein